MSVENNRLWNLVELTESRLYFIYHFPVDPNERNPNGIPFGSKSLGKYNSERNKSLINLTRYQRRLFSTPNLYFIIFSSKFATFSDKCDRSFRLCTDRFGYCGYYGNTVIITFLIIPVYVT